MWFALALLLTSSSATAILLSGLSSCKQQSQLLEARERCYMVWVGLGVPRSRLRRSAIEYTGVGEECYSV